MQMTSSGQNRPSSGQAMTRRGWIIWGTLLVLVLGIGAWMLWGWLDERPSATAGSRRQTQGTLPARKTPQSAASLVTPSAATEKKPGTAEAPVSGATRQAAQAPQAIQAPQASVSTDPAQTLVTAGSLGRLSALRSEKEELKLQVDIRELREKLHPTAPVAVAVAPAARPQDGPLLLPMMSLPEASPARTAASPSRTRGPVVVSVEGVGGALSAVVRTGNNTVTLRKRSRFGGGVVTELSRAAVIVTRGGKAAALPFE